MTDAEKHPDMIRTQARQNAEMSNLRATLIDAMKKGTYTRAQVSEALGALTAQQFKERQFVFENIEGNGGTSPAEVRRRESNVAATRAANEKFAAQSGDSLDQMAADNAAVVARNAKLVNRAAKGKLSHAALDKAMTTPPRGRVIGVRVMKVLRAGTRDGAQLWRLELQGGRRVGVAAGSPAAEKAASIAMLLTHGPRNVGHKVNVRVTERGTVWDFD